MESDTKTDSEMETEADSEGQYDVPQKTNLVLAKYAETDSKANDDSDDESDDDVEEVDTETNSEMITEADSEGQSDAPQKTSLILAKYAETDSKVNDDSCLLYTSPSPRDS